MKRASRAFDFVMMFNRVVTLDSEFARQLPRREFELGFDEVGSIYIDGEPPDVNVKQRYRALRPHASRRS